MAALRRGSLAVQLAAAYTADGRVDLGEGLHGVPFASDKMPFHGDRM